MYTYRNSFHSTEYRSMKSAAELEAIAQRIATGKATEAEKAFQRRMKKALCCVAECQCGDDFGRRL